MGHVLLADLTMSLSCSSMCSSSSVGCCCCSIDCSEVRESITELKRRRTTPHNNKLADSKVSEDEQKCILFSFNRILPTTLTSILHRLRPRQRQQQQQKLESTIKNKESKQRITCDDAKESEFNVSNFEFNKKILAKTEIEKQFSMPKESRQRLKMQTTSPFPLSNIFNQLKLAGRDKVSFRPFFFPNQPSMQNSLLAERRRMPAIDNNLRTSGCRSSNSIAMIILLLFSAIFCAQSNTISALVNNQVVFPRGTAPIDYHQLTGCDKCDLRSTYCKHWTAENMTCEVSESITYF